MKSLPVRYLLSLILLALAVPFLYVFQTAMIQFGFLPQDISKLTSLHMFSLILVQALIFCSICLFFIFKLKINFYGLGDDLGFLDYIKGFLGLFGINILASVILSKFNALPNQFQDFNVDLLKEQAGLMVFTVAFLGPVYEEFVFRSVILGMLSYDQKETIKKAFAVFFTSLVFAGAHYRDIIENHYMVFPLFLLGLYFGFWTIRKKGIMLPMVLHMSQNFMAALGMLYAK